VIHSLLIGLLMGPLACLATHEAHAATPSSNSSAKSAATKDDEDLFDDKLKEFGYWSGAALSCVPEAKKAGFERTTLETFDRIARLFGTDRAFFYAAAFGNGTAVIVDKAKCPELLEKLEKARDLRGNARSVEQ
jgi:hypothetical protein